MAMAEVYVPNHACDSLPPLCLPSASHPTFPSPPPSTCSSYHDEQDHGQTTPPAPPPSPQEPVKFGPIFEIDASYFERPRKSELPPSPTNSLDFSAIFTPNKSPLESEPHSPVQASPADTLDSLYSSGHTSLSQQSNTGSSRSIPIHPVSLSGRPVLFCSNSDDPTFLNNVRSQTTAAPHIPSRHHLSAAADSASPALRPRSHTHPSHTLTPHLSLFHEQQQQQHRHDILLDHPHLPRSFDATQLTERGMGILDSGYHEAAPGDLPLRHRKLNLKRKSEELGYDGEAMDLFSCDSWSESGCSGSDSEWRGAHKCSKKACQEGKNPVIRRQSSSFSGGFTYQMPTARESLLNSSAPSTPGHSINLFPLQDPVRLQNCPHQPSLSPPVFPSPHHSPFTPTPSTDIPTGLQSMELAEEGAMDSMDTSDHCVDMDCLSSQLRVSHLEYVSHGNVAPPTHTLALPQAVGHRSHSSDDSYYFGPTPQLALGSEFHFTSYHESSQNVLNETSAENRFLLSKSL